MCLIYGAKVGLATVFFFFFFFLHLHCVAKRVSMVTRCDALYH